MSRLKFIDCLVALLLVFAVLCVCFLTNSSQTTFNRSQLSSALSPHCYTAELPVRQSIIQAAVLYTLTRLILYLLFKTLLACFLVTFCLQSGLALRSHDVEECGGLRVGRPSWVFNAFKSFSHLQLSTAECWWC